MDVLISFLEEIILGINLENSKTPKKRKRMTGDNKNFPEKNLFTNKKYTATNHRQQWKANQPNSINTVSLWS